MDNKEAELQARSPLKEAGPFLLGAVIFAAALALYVRTLAPSVMPGDYAEFQMSAAILGIPHPTGYPLYILLGKLFTFLPFGDIAYRVNFSSAVYMAGAATLVYAISLRLLARLGLGRLLWLAAFGAGFFTLAPTVWAMSLVARSYALNALLVSGVVYSLVSWRFTGRPRFFYAACVLTGMSMAHHGTTYLLLPAYGLYLLFCEIVYRKQGEGAPAKEQVRRPAHRRRVGFGLLAFLAGYSPMLFLVYRFVGGAPYYWGNPTTWSDFFNLLRGGPFKDQFFAFGWGAQLDRVGFGLGELSGQYTPAGILLGIVGLVVLWRSLRPEAALLTLMMLGNFFFAMNYSLVGYLYFIPTYLIWGVLMSTGAAWLVAVLAKRVGRIPVARYARLLPALNGVLAAGLLVLGVYAMAVRLPNIDQSEQTGVRDRALALLRAAPEHSAMYLDWEDLSVIRFYRLAYGMRPDITLRSGDPADWAKWIYCDLDAGIPAYVGQFAGAQPAVVARDFSLQPAPIGWRVAAITNPRPYAAPPCGTCATCR